MSAVSLSFFKVLGFLHGTSTGKPSGRSTPLQKVAIKSLCILPGWTPCAPHLAMDTNSSCWAPSSSAHSASHLMVLPDTFPCAQRLKRAVARLLWGPFSRSSSGFSISFSSFQPLSLLTMLLQQEPFSRFSFLFQESCFFFKKLFFQEERFLFQENSFSRQLSFKNLFQDLDQWNLHTTHLQLPTLSPNVMCYLGSLGPL